MRFIKKKYYHYTEKTLTINDVKLSINPFFPSRTFQGNLLEIKKRRWCDFVFRASAEREKTFPTALTRAKSTSNPLAARSVAILIRTILCHAQWRH